ncbi:ROK family protein [Ornithinimicrobium sp. INDO-MA30-4]|uniref:ROK family protein n=1 Tax=Ornithinimicrobium sp. INDO-MA30-4 TaxID=2908651 RepID=UPI0037C6B3ED
MTLTLGTGIGGAIVMDGRVERGQHGMAGEFGHMIMVPHGRRCECGNRGCWEQYASGNVLQREGQALARAGGPLRPNSNGGARGDQRQSAGLSSPKRGSRVTQPPKSSLAEVGRWLGLGLANLAAALDPGCIVIGGGVIAAGDLILDPAREEMARNLPGRGHRPLAPIVAAELGPRAGLIGAADLARRDF